MTLQGQEKQEGGISVKSKLLKLIAKSAEHMAKVSCESTSWFAMYQPETPKALRRTGSEKRSDEEVS